MCRSGHSPGWAARSYIHTCLGGGDGVSAKIVKNSAVFAAVKRSTRPSCLDNVSQYLRGCSVSVIVGVRLGAVNPRPPGEKPPLSGKKPLAKTFCSCSSRKRNTYFVSRSTTSYNLPWYHTSSDPSFSNKHARTLSISGSACGFAFAKAIPASSLALNKEKEK